MSPQFAAMKIIHYTIVSTSSRVVTTRRVLLRARKLLRKLVEL